MNPKHLLASAKPPYPMTTTTLAAPVAQSERIFTLDMIRGIAILGILLMNMPMFSTPFAIALDPFVLNEHGTMNYRIWYAVNWIFDGTQRALFSILFGAGIVLFVSRQEKKFNGLTPADYFFRRQLWLILFSLIDVYILLWNGDILLDYACFGMLLFVFRNLSPRALIVAASVSMLLMIARENRDLYERKSIIREGEAIAALDTTVTKLSLIQRETFNKMKEFKESSQRDAKLKESTESIEKFTTSYASVYNARTNDYVGNLSMYMYFSPWDVLTCMLLGMALFKLGILTGTAPLRAYTWMCVGGLGIGLFLSWIRMEMLIANRANWFEIVKNLPFSFYELTRIPRALGILGLIMLLYKSNLFKWIFSSMRAVGQMAFTNYLMQSLICGVLFNAYGFKLYGQLERYETYLIVLYIWIFQIIFSNVWMRYFLFGPFEWAWRSLTYWKIQPFVRARENAVDVLAPS